MDITSSKRERSTAKRLFTRSKNGLASALKNEDDVSIVENRFTDLKKRFDGVIEHHENYISLFEDDGAGFDEEVEGKWIADIEEDFTEIERSTHYYIKKCLSSTNAKRILDDEPMVKTVVSNVLATQDDSKQLRRAQNIRTLEKSNFAKEVALCENLLSDIGDTCAKEIIDSIKESQRDVKQQVEKCKTAQANYIALLEGDSIESEIKWMEEILQTYSVLSHKVVMAAKKQENLKATSRLKLEPMKMPRFNGDMRDYPRFKHDFIRQIVPEIKNKESHAYVLKSCLTEIPLNLVKNVDDDMSEMWKRLDEKYGKASKLIDAVMIDMKNTKPVLQGDNKRFIEFVDIIERGYRDLTRMNLEREMSNSTSVSMIEEKLPTDIRERWYRVVNKTENHVDDTDKFPHLLPFLLEQKRWIEYGNSDLRKVSHRTITGSANHYQDHSNDSGNDSNAGMLKCWIHNSNDHLIGDCPEFIGKDAAEKLQLVKDHRACWTCLRIGHRSAVCYIRKVCGLDDCKMYHHRLLHECQIKGLSFHTACHSNTKFTQCLLQVMKVATKVDDESVNVLWDGGSTISLITFACADKINLKGEAVTLNVVMVGGQTETIESFKYDLTLIDKNTNEVEFIVYGIKKISTNLERICVKNVANLFVNVKPSEVTRPVGEIDLLIGFEYAGYHPSRIDAVDHLLLLENRFGRCLGGSHHSLMDMGHKIIQHVTINHLKGATISDFISTESLGIGRSLGCFQKSQVDTSYTRAQCVTVNHLKNENVDDFLSTESLGIECTPKCGNCRCGKCPIGSKNYSIKDERELKLIEQGLRKGENCWEAKYPWIRNPNDLPNNKAAALSMLKSTEKRLRLSQDHALVYNEQIHDMVERNVARMLFTEEWDAHKGPVHYLSHHEVLKPDSNSTPCRIVFNSSAQFHGHVLNDYWAKGPDLLNNILGVLIRFREGYFAIAGDISKMYHSIGITYLDQHTHRFLWRDMDDTRAPDEYVMTKVSFGDRPAGAIATLALRKTAEEQQEIMPRAAEMIIKNSYVDDMIDSFDSIDEGRTTIGDTNVILKTGGFKIKHWITSFDHTFSTEAVTNGLPLISELTSAEETADACNCQSSGIVNEIARTNDFDSERAKSFPSDDSKVLGVYWDPHLDCFKYKVKLNFSPRKRKIRTGPDITLNNLLNDSHPLLTKRTVLSQVNGIHDPLGFATPFTVRAKLLMQRLWVGDAKQLSWDDVLPADMIKEWMELFKDLFALEDITFARCIKPDKAVGLPILIVFADGSEKASGACAYVRWLLDDGSYKCHLVMSKGKIAPLKRITIVRLELNGALIAKRLYVFLKNESRLVFAKVYFIVDSEIVRAMIQNDSYGFNTFAAVRIGEIQELTQKTDWYWVDGKLNISDFLTRGKHPNELNETSLWQQGPEFLRLPEDQWPLKQTEYLSELPERPKSVMMVNSIVESESLASRISIDRFSSYLKLINTTARVLSMFKNNPKPSFKNVIHPVTKIGFEEAEIFWIKEVQSLITEHDLKKRYLRLGPRRDEVG